MARKFKTTFMALCFSGLALFAGLKGYTVAFIGALLVLLAIAMAFLWNHFVFSQLKIERKISRRQIEFGAPVTMQLRITNRKILPLFGLKVGQHISPGLHFGDSRHLLVIKEGAYNIFRDFFHLNWYEKRGRNYELIPLRRGRFEFGPGSLSYADPFGFFANEQEEVFPSDQLIVFPKVLPVRGLAALNTYLFGTRPKEGWIFTDPLNRIGTRPYESTDSARLINWKATARHIHTQVNVEKPSFDQQVQIILEQPPDALWWTEVVANNLEVAIMATASLIHSYSASGYEILFTTNLVSKLQGLSRASSKVTRGRVQRSQLLTNLALLQNFSVNSITDRLENKNKQIRAGSTVVIISTAKGELDPNFVQALRRLNHRSKVALIRVLPTNEHTERLDGIKEWRIEGGEPWHEMVTLELS